MTTSITVHTATEVSLHEEPGLISRLLLGRQRRDYAVFLISEEWYGPDNRSLPDRLQDRIERAVTWWHVRQRIDQLSKRQ